MKRVLINCLNRFRLIRLLFTADIYVLVMRHPTPNRSALIETNIEQFGAIAHVLRDSARQLEEAQQAADTLVNQLGIKKPND